MATREELKQVFANRQMATGEKFANLIDSMKVVQLPVVDPVALGTSLSFIDSISQDADGKITATKKTLDLSNAHELNPFKGWYKTGDTLPTDGFDGAYLYFKDTTQTPAVTTIYQWNGTTYVDTGTEVDESNVQTFGSGQAVNAVKIKDENGVEVTGNADVLSAEAGVKLSGEVVKVSRQSLLENQKDTARDNIEAMRQLYAPFGSGEGLYEYLGDGEVYTDANILSMDNVFDKSKIISGKWIDDSGNIIDYASMCYIDVFIPVYGGVKLICNYNLVGVALYDSNKNFIHNDGGSWMANTVYTLNARMYQSTIAYVKLKFSNNTATTNKDAIMVSMIKKADGQEPVIPQEYVPFGMYQGGLVPSRSFVYKSDFSQFQLKEKSDDSIIKLLQNYFPTETLFSDITPWEPTTVDSGYSNPTSGWGNDTYRADWTATDKYMYYEFLAHYYDTYLGSHDNGTYSVTKRGLWQDGAHTGHEVFEYRFTPINYKYTVMLSAGMNADETQGIWGLATFIRCLMNEEEPNMAIMKKNIRFIIIPIINASGFDQARLRYTYSNGVNPNYNFNYKDSWEQNTASVALKGDYPDSNIETQGLKKWINEYSGVALLYVDLHTGRFQQNNDPTATGKTILDVRFGNTSPYYNDFNNVHRPLVKQFYVNKGYITNDDNIGGASSVATSIDYQKHAYAVQVCGINSAMPEMHIESTGYGADGLTNNSTYGIKGYVLQIRQIIMFVVNKFTSEHSTIALVGNDAVRLQNNYK